MINNQGSQSEIPHHKKRKRSAKI